MAHRVSAKAADDLDEIWLYVAEESGSIERADRLIRALADRFYLLSDYPFSGALSP